MISSRKINLLEEKEVKKLLHAEDRKGLSKTFVQHDTLNIPKMFSNNNRTTNHIKRSHQRVFYL